MWRSLREGWGRLHKGRCVQRRQDGQAPEGAPAYVLVARPGLSVRAPMGGASSPQGPLVLIPLLGGILGVVWSRACCELPYGERLKSEAASAARAPVLPELGLADPRLPAR